MEKYLSRRRDAIACTTNDRHVTRLRHGVACRRVSHTTETETSKLVWNRKMRGWFNGQAKTSSCHHVSIMNIISLQNKWIANRCDHCISSVSVSTWIRSWACFVGVFFIGTRHLACQGIINLLFTIYVCDRCVFYYLYINQSYIIHIYYEYIRNFINKPSDPTRLVKINGCWLDYLQIATIISQRLPIYCINWWNFSNWTQIFLNC